MVSFLFYSQVHKEAEMEQKFLNIFLPWQQFEPSTTGLTAQQTNF